MSFLLVEDQFALARDLEPVERLPMRDANLVLASLEQRFTGQRTNRRIAQGGPVGDLSHWPRIAKIEALGVVSVHFSVLSAARLHHSSPPC